MPERTVRSGLDRGCETFDRAWTVPRSYLDHMPQCSDRVWIVDRALGRGLFSQSGVLLFEFLHRDLLF